MCADAYVPWYACGVILKQLLGTGSCLPPGWGRVFCVVSAMLHVLRYLSCKHPEESPVSTSHLTCKYAGVTDVGHYI